MISSCSAWIVATMSPSWPVRPRSSAASSVLYPRSPESGPSALALDRPVEPVVVADTEVALAEQLVLQPQQGAALHGEVPAAGEAHRLAAGGPVERLGDGCPPVDDDRFALLVGDRQAADVERLEPVGCLGHPVDAAEDQRCVAEVELGQPVDHGLVEHIALVARLKGAAEGALVEVSHPPGRVAADLETPVGVLDEFLFGGKIGVLLRHGSFNSIGLFLHPPPTRIPTPPRGRTDLPCHTPRLA